MNQELDRICNIAGYPMYKWAADQLKTRSELGSQKTRDDDNILYLANKGAWIRAISSVNIANVHDTSLSTYEKITTPTSLFKYYQDLTGNQIGKEEDLSKNFILYGGTSIWKDKQMQLRSGIDLGGAYNITGTQSEINNFGYRPMPGITSVTIESTGRLGSLRQATINFKVWDKLQLDIMDALYFRPGFTVLIEYGHAKYYDNSGILQSSEKFMIDNPFDTSLTKEDINIKISTNIRQSYGNYGGMLGLITHFDFGMNADGGYDCTVKAMSLGAVMGNFPINHIDIFSKAYQNQLRAYLNIEKTEAEKKAADENNKKKNEEIEAANEQLKNSDSEGFAKLKITDPYTILLYNTGNLTGGIVNIKNPRPTPTSQPITVNGVTVTPPSPVISSTATTLRGQSQIQPILPGSVQYSLEKIIVSTNTYKDTHDISLSSTSTNLKAYYLENNMDPGIIYFVKSFDFGNNIVDKYIASSNIQGQDTPTYVKLNISQINSIITNKQDSTLKIEGGVNTQSSWKKTYSNYFDVLVNENKTGASDYFIDYTYFGAINPSDTAFSITLNFPKGENAKAQEYFTDPNTKYKILEISNKVPILHPNSKLNTNILLQVVDSNGNEQSEYKIRLGGSQTDDFGKIRIADLSFIGSIEGNQDLSENKDLQKYNAAVAAANRDASARNMDTKNKIENDYSAEQVKLTTESQSTLELMLRSIFLREINSVFHKDTIQQTSDDKFISDLFSEGCYSSFFSNGIPKIKDYPTDTLKKYVEASINSKERLGINLSYGNNYYLMSSENVYDENGVLKDSLLQNIPQVDFKTLFNFFINDIGETADIGVSAAADKQISVYIPLGLFFLFLNHTAMLYNTENTEALKKGDTIVPMTYIDFNPNTNFFLSNQSQMSLDPFKFLVPFMGGDTGYDKLFKNIDKNRTLFTKASGSNISPEPLFSFKQDVLSPALNTTFKNPLGKDTPNGYVGKLMYVMTDINYLLRIIKEQRNNSETGQVFFQTTIEKILLELNKALGGYNAFRLSYNDNSNCYIITDDQLQGAPDAIAKSVMQDGIDGSTSFEIPVYGNKSIARAFEMRTDMSGRIASLLAISANPIPGNQVATAKNTSDFGIYNKGTYDRFIKGAVDSVASDKESKDNFAEFEAQVNFNTIVKTIYTAISKQEAFQKDAKTEYMNANSVERALSYYTNAIAKRKNESAGAATAMIIPMKTNITIDGMSGLYPFQLFTVSENVMPYRYSRANLVDKRPAFSIARMTHTISNNEWTTSIEGFMTLMRDQKDYDDTLQNIKYKEHPFIPPAITTSDNVVLSENAKTIYKFFIAQKFTPAQASGFVGNFYQESKWDPNASQIENTPPLTHDVGYGIAQWTASDRQDNLRKFAEQKNKSINDLMIQLQFVMSELLKDLPLRNKIKAAISVEEATRIIMEDYEKPGKPEFQNRIAAANRIFNDPPLIV
jgi:hypothetical protein